MAGILIKKGNFGHRHAQREDDIETQGEHDYRQAKEKGLEQILSHSPQREPILVNPLIAEFWPPKLLRQSMSVV